MAWATSCVPENCDPCSDGIILRACDPVVVVPKKLLLAITKLQPNASGGTGCLCLEGAEADLEYTDTLPLPAGPEWRGELSGIGDCFNEFFVCSHWWRDGATVRFLADPDRCTFFVEIFQVVPLHQVTEIPCEGPGKLIRSLSWKTTSVVPSPFQITGELRFIPDNCEAASQLGVSYAAEIQITEDS